MTREKQLNNAASDYVNQRGTTAEWCDGWEDFNDAEYVEKAFKAGAEWEHKRLVHNACDWLKENLSEGYDADNYPMVRCYDIDMEDFIKEFSREMEE